MKNFLVAFAASVMAIGQMQAQTPSVNFTYAEEPAQAMSLGLAKGTQVWLAFEIPASMASSFAGNEITSVNITSGVYKVMNQESNPARNVNIFIAEDLMADPVYTQSAKLGNEAFTEYNVELTTPYKIEEGKSMFVGYSFAVNDAPANKRSYYICVDGVPSTEPACWYGYLKNGKMVWAQDAAEVGSICMGCVISGDNLPQNGAILKGLALSDPIEPDKDFFASLDILGSGVQDVKSIEIAYTIGDGSEQKSTIVLGSPVSFGKKTRQGTAPLRYDKQELFVPMNVRVTKVNGSENDIKSAEDVSSTFNCFVQNTGAKRMRLIEEATGTWCGYCPRGIVMMEYARDTYPDDFARVALHNSDEMSNNSSESMIQWLGVPGFPQAYVDRTFGEDPGYGTQFLPTFAKKKLTAPAAITGIEVGMNADNTIAITAKVKPAFSSANPGRRMRLAYYLVEDGVGPYMQANYYAGGSLGTLEGWSDKTAYVSTIYDDVCRLYIGEFTGIANSLPDRFVEGEEVTHTVSADADVIAGDKFRVIALLVDGETGETMNVAQIEASKSGAEGAISEVEAIEAVTVTYHDLAGRRVENPSVGGIYVRTVRYSDGSVRSDKVIR